MNVTTTGGTGGNGLVPQNMEQAVRMAELMAQAKTLPQHLQRNPGDCLMVVEQAMRWRMSPFAVAQCTSVIQGKLMFEGKLVAAALHSSGALSTRLAYDYKGEGDAREIIVSATLAGETAPRSVVVKYKDAKTTNGMWTKQPDQQLAYHGARVWARRFAPEVMLGVYAPEEMEAPAPRPADTHTGPTIDGRAEPAPPTEAPRRTTRQWLADLEQDLIRAAEEGSPAVEARLARDDVQTAIGVLQNGAKAELQRLIDTARAGYAPSDATFIADGERMET